MCTACGARIGLYDHEIVSGQHEIMKYCITTPLPQPGGGYVCPPCVTAHTNTTIPRVDTHGGTCSTTCVVLQNRHFALCRQVWVT